jgi:1-phosphofructokinase family hexose kinase
MIRTQDGITPIAFWTQSATREVVTIVEEGTHRQAAFKEPGSGITPTEQKSLMILLTALMAQYEWVVFSGSMPCAGLDHMYRDLIGAVSRNGGKAALDSSGKALVEGLRAGPFLSKLNLDEAAYVLGRPLRSEEDVWQGVADLSENRDSPHFRIVAVTAGRQGAYVACGKERWRAFPPPVKTVNPVGSGDSFLAGMVAGLARGQSVEESLRLGMAAGAANAAVWDAATFTLADVERLLPKVDIRKV